MENGAATKADQNTAGHEAITIELFSNGDEQRWDDYIFSRDDSTFFHRIGWRKILEKTLNHKSYYLLAKTNAGDIKGVMPLGHIKSKLFGNSLISLPFAVYGGAIADTREIKTMLEKRACQIAEDLKVDALELREREICYPDWPTKELYVTFRKEISLDHEENLKAIPRKQRAVVRKGIKAELISEIDTDIDRFFHAYSFSVWRLGTPVFPKKYFQAIKDEFANDCDIVTILKDKEVIASVMNFYFKNEVIPYYGGGTDAARAYKGNDFMYWEVMRRAADKGYTIFDYGRSKIGTGAYSFKKNWGFEPQPLPYQYYLVKANQMPEINPLNPKYRLFVNGWKKMPLSLSRKIGPLLAKNLG
ncbi:MAG: FemAB family PEP-CTERM system-associated protein [Gammaproteobacteria bacterium]|nr:MAG: FemAB family PEP-CTERM system-associated protein [Gammaproteobacteria bacterium]